LVRYAVASSRSSSGPSIVLVAGLAYFAPVLCGPRDSLQTLYLQRRHSAA
jgi:hypothetical protein